VHGLLQRCSAETKLIIDGTGVGRPVADMFKWHGVTPWCVTATAGIEQTIDTAARTANVPKLLLISRIQSLLFEGRLKVHDRIDEAPAFLAELRDFRVEYSASGRVSRAREKRVAAQRRLLDKAGPVGSDRLSDHLMRDVGKPGALERGRDLGPSGKLGVDQRLQREEMPMREIALLGAVANADVAAIAQHPAAFPRGGGRVAPMVIDHRHEDEIGAAVR
jgi:hypothetical protein